MKMKRIIVFSVILITFFFLLFLAIKAPPIPSQVRDLNYNDPNTLTELNEELSKFYKSGKIIIEKANISEYDASNRSLRGNSKDKTNHSEENEE
jgi:predicted PurR-regulated permease PerM